MQNIELANKNKNNINYNLNKDYSYETFNGNMTNNLVKNKSANKKRTSGFRRFPDLNTFQTFYEERL